MIKIPPGNEHTHKQTKRGMRREKERERKRKSFFARKQINSPGVHVRPHVVVVVVLVVLAKAELRCCVRSHSSRRAEKAVKEAREKFKNSSRDCRVKKHSRNFSRIFLIRNDFDDTTIGYDTDDESKVFIIIIAQK